ncbi:MAG: hypothetical protein CMJ96_00185 [Planctomycetes bacterium]|jgi:hypothetical protein|nr:hypothetical protein [Planctomycetota bacterium]MDP6128119.1 hypothetical protein [Planctomycetota bacterium]
MYRPSNSNLNGSVLLMTLVISGLIAMVSLSFGESVSSQMGVARKGMSALHADLAAQSGLEYARRRVSLDPTWQGTSAEEANRLAPLGFSVIREPGEVSEFFPTQASFVVEGTKGEAHSKIRTSMDIEPGDPVRTKALSVLGGDFSGENVDINGDAIWIDLPEFAWVFKHGFLEGNDVHVSSRTSLGAWERPSTARPRPNLQVARMNLRGLLFRQISDNNAPDSECELQQPVHIPGWSLDPWLQENECTRVFRGNRRLKDIKMKKTAVVLLEAGETLVLEDVQLFGGLVLWCENNYNPSDGPRNTIVLRGKNYIGGEPECGGSVGLIAPGARVISTGGRKTDIHGLSLWHSAWHLRRIISRGVTIVLDEINNMKDCSFDYNFEIANNPPSGILFFGDMPKVDVTSVSEKL